MWTVKGQDPKGNWLQESAIGTWETRKAPVVHFNGQTVWLAQTGTNGWATPQWRANVTDIWPGRWTGPAAIASSLIPFSVAAVLDAPALATYNQRMYAIHHH
ncbi:hypothetical protein ACFYNW_38115 [Streptomyces virginiae]|uniref:hypothetical protein n=1 Tax=Streptomyces virginiae TaxID=1961 RepID=UPI0036ED76B7